MKSPTCLRWSRSFRVWKASSTTVPTPTQPKTAVLSTTHGRCPFVGRLPCLSYVKVSSNEQRQILYCGSFADGWRDLAGSSNPQYPALNLRCFALSRRESGSQETSECTVEVGAAHPFRNGECVVLVVVTILLRKASSPKRWIDFCDDGSSRRHIPAIERPKVNGGCM